MRGIRAIKTQLDFYVIGGTMQRDAPSYVTRQADTDLYEGLTEGKFCYVLTSRQMGKSSLMVRTAVRLREEGAAVAVLDLTAIGQNLTAEQWYDGLLGLIGQQLDLEDELEEFWIEHERLGPLQRWMKAIKDVVLARSGDRVVIFVDEIDAVRSLQFSTSEFFAGIRELYNRRAQDPDLARLTFCLLGVATPTDLIQDTRTTPFNIGRRIELSDFTESSASPLLEGLEGKRPPASALLKRILFWTGGHPYLTQRLCQAVGEIENVAGDGDVDRICEELFLSSRARTRDDNLLFVRERILRGETDVAGLLDLYDKVRRGRRVRDDETNPLVSILRLSGITRVVDGRLVVRNRIYSRVFDREWVTTSMPDSELRRQRAAYRRGLMRAIVVANIIIMVVGGLAFIALRQRQWAVEQQEIAQRQRKRAEEAAYRADTLLQETRAALMEAENQKTFAEQQRHQALEQKRFAEQQQAEAVRQKSIADEQKRQAEAQKRAAEEQRTEAEQQRHQALEQKRIADQLRLDAEEIRRELEVERRGKQSQEPADLNEVTAWERVKDETDPGIFKAFLETYPAGKLAEAAKSKLRELEQLPRKAPSSLPVQNHTFLTGAIQGRVYEIETSRPLAGALVVIKNQDNGNERSAATDSTGEYVLGYLPPGSYTITIIMQSYRKESVANVQVRIGATLQMPPSFGGLRKL